MKNSLCHYSQFYFLISIFFILHIEYKFFFPISDYETLRALDLDNVSIVHKYS